jgi:hypothetical protein
MDFFKIRKNYWAGAGVGTASTGATWTSTGAGATVASVGVGTASTGAGATVASVAGGTTTSGVTGVGSGATVASTGGVGRVSWTSVGLAVQAERRLARISESAITRIDKKVKK